MRGLHFVYFFVHYEWRKVCTRLGDTGLVVELEHLKIKTRLIDEKFVSVIGECVM